MRSRAFVLWAAMAILGSLSACGSGGGTTSTAPTPAVDNSASVAAAAAAQLTATTDINTNLATVSWKDTFPAGAAYDVQAKGPDGVFTTVETVAGGGTGATLTWQRPATVSATYRVQARVAAGAFTLQTVAAFNQVDVYVSSMPLSIAVDQQEPVSGTVQLSIVNGSSLTSVKWSVDSQALTAEPGPGGAVPWDANASPEGPHVILARSQISPDSYVEIRRTIQTKNSNLSVYAIVRGTTGTILLDVTASSSPGIQSVSATFDGAPAGTLTAPNACAPACAGQIIVYRFFIDAAIAGSGTHTAVVTATDNNGAARSLTVQVPINNVPVLAVTTPMSGAILTGTLNLSGTVTSDRPGNVAVTASLGSTQFLNTSVQGNFTGTLDLSGVAPGNYTVTVTAKDSSGTSSVIQRSVVVATNQSVAYQPLFMAGKDGTLLAASATRVLYSRNDEVVRLRTVATGAEIVLPGVVGGGRTRSWRLAGDRVYAVQKDSDCTSLSCIYEWTADGTRTNLSEASPGRNEYDEAPVAHDHYVIWASTRGSAGGHYTLFDTAARTYRTIGQPAGAGYVLNGGFDFTVQGGRVYFFYPAAAAAGTPRPIDIYRWVSDTGVSTKLTFGMDADSYALTDGTSVTWRHDPVGLNVNGTALQNQALAGGATRQISDSAQTLYLAGDGVTAWTERPSSGVLVLKVLYQGNVTTLATSSAIVLNDVESGFVVYSKEGKTYSWNAATGEIKVRLDSALSQAILAGNVLYASFGSDVVVYRIVLD